MAPVNSLYHRTLCVKGGFSCFILSNLVHSVLAAFLAFAVGLLGLGYVHLQLFVTRRDSFSACFANENIFWDVNSLSNCELSFHRPTLAVRWPSFKHCAMRTIIYSLLTILIDCPWLSKTWRSITRGRFQQRAPYFTVVLVVAAAKRKFSIGKIVFDSIAYASMKSIFCFSRRFQSVRTIRFQWYICIGLDIYTITKSELDHPRSHGTHKLPHNIRYDYIITYRAS